MICICATTLAISRVLEGCSICASLSPTLCDEIGAADFAVFAQYVETPQVDPGINDPEAYKSSFRIEEILKGAQEIGEEETARVLFFPGESANPGDRYLMHGNWVESDDQTSMIIRWTTPIAVTDEAIEYLHRMWKLPKEDVQRLIEAKAYLQSSDPMLRRDAFDEFGKAPYELLEELSPVLDKNTLITKIQDLRTDPNIKKLYYTLLTICGTQEELPFLKSQIDKEKVNASESLPAIIACYLSLSGAEGLPFIEKTYLMEEGSDHERRAGATITALRFHGQEASVIDRDKIVEIFLRMLQRPTLGARILSDLARWEDWSAVDQVAEMFLNAEGDALWIREPAVRYLLVCPTKNAEDYIPKLEKIDALAVQNGRRFALPRTMSSAVTGAGERKSKSTVATNERVNNSKNQDRYAKDPVASGSEAQNENSGLVVQKSDRWPYSLPLAVGVIFVLLLGWLLMRRG
jgi:hypothetical protein